LAPRAARTSAAIYRHFDGKEALLAAVAAEGFRLFGSCLMAALARPAPLDRMRAAGEQYMRFALERPRDYRVIFMSEVPDHLAPAPGATAPSFQFLVDR